MKRFFVSLLVISLILVGGGTAYVTFYRRIEPVVSSRPVALLPVTDGTLDLSHRALATFGPEVYDNVLTMTLILSDNQLRSLPSKIGQMTGLTVLKADNNQLDGVLPKELTDLRLTALDVSHNNMSTMPPEISRLKTLQMLDYSYNNLTDVPVDVISMKGLVRLDLTGNPISPSTIAMLKSQMPSTAIIF